MRAMDIFSESIIHRRAFGALKGFLTGGFTGAVGGFLGGGGASSAVPQRTSGPPGIFNDNGGPCSRLGFIRDPISGVCVDPLGPAGLSTGAGGAAAAVARPGGVDGQLPSARSTRTLICPPGMVLSKDDRCFHSLSRKERKWDPGRRPLLTGGERNAITKAAAAARKIQRTQKQLQKLGMLKKPSSRPRHVHAPRQPLRLTSSDPDVRIINVGD